jgi:hypothetical protein
MDYTNGTELWKYQWDLIHNPETIVLESFNEEAGAYTDTETAQKVLQTIRCAYLSNQKDIDISQYLQRLKFFRSGVRLPSGGIDICIEYDTDKKLVLPDKPIGIAGDYDKTEYKILYSFMGIEPPKNFKYKYSLGGLTIYAQDANFGAYLNPTKEQTISDAEAVLRKIDLANGIDLNEINSLKTIASCESKYIKASERYKIIVEISKTRTILEKEEDLVLDLLETSLESSDFNAFAELLANDAFLWHRLYKEMTDFTIPGSPVLREKNKTRLISLMCAIWQQSKYKSRTLFAYNDKSPEVFRYNPTGYPRSMGRNYVFSAKSNGVLNIDVKMGEGDMLAFSSLEATYNYGLFQPVRLTTCSSGKWDFPKDDMPAFLLMALDEKADAQSLKNAYSLQFDLLVTLTGVGSLAHLSKIQKAGKWFYYAKLTFGTIDIAASTVDIITRYTDVCKGSDEFCANLQATVFWVQMASLSGDALASTMARKYAGKTIAAQNKADGTLLANTEKAEVRKFLDEVAGEVTNGGKAGLLNKFKDFPVIKSWINSLDDVADASLLTKLDNLDAGYFSKLEADLASNSMGAEIKGLLKNGEDVDIWKLLKDDPKYSFELAKTGGSGWEKWSKGNFFKEVTQAGKAFEGFVAGNLNTLRSKIMAKYPNIDLNNYAVFEQVQIKTGKIVDGADEYFIADFVLVKKNKILGQEILDFNDAIVLETKLSIGTPLTTPQTSALAKVKTTSNTFDVRSVNNGSTTNATFSLGSSPSASSKTVKINDYIKVYSDGTGNVIQDIISLK